MVILFVLASIDVILQSNYYYSGNDQLISVSKLI